MILYSCAVALLLSLPPILGWGHFAPEENGMRWEQIYIISIQYLKQYLNKETKNRYLKI